MDPNIGLLFALALALGLAWITTSLLFKEKRGRTNDLRRYRDAATKHRSLVADQKDELVNAIVVRVLIRRKKLPPCNLGIFNKVTELYNDPALDGRDFPINVYDDGQTFAWSASILFMSDREVFALWMERVIE